MGIRKNRTVCDRWGAAGRDVARWAGTGWLLLALPLQTAWAQGLPAVADFARLPALRNIVISPDGEHVALITHADHREVVVVGKAQGLTEQRVVLTNDSEVHFRISWCDWANDVRLLCGFSGNRHDNRVTYSISRLVAVDADGSDLKVLLENSRAGSAQFHDRILDIDEADPETVLIHVDPDLDGFPSVARLDIRSGRYAIVERERVPARTFVTDGQGEVRLAYGYRGDKVFYFVRGADDRSWREIGHHVAFDAFDSPIPEAVVPGRDEAYAIGTHDGRDAIYQLDLASNAEPELLAHHPRVDLDGLLLGRDQRLIGFHYDAEKPGVHYIDSRFAAIQRMLAERFADRSVFIADMSDDERRLIVRTDSDVHAGEWFLLDLRGADARLQSFGDSRPALPPAAMQAMQPIRYPARDGTSIPGYLTRPAGAGPFPLVVLPHGGPRSRDRWGFDPLVQFLASRGYAVLQMNFRGSSGFGVEWLYAAHQDWGGLTYDDIVDGTRWAAQQTFIDARRTCIVGWSFGGYAALLGAVRNPDLFRCAASIAGVSDLVDLQMDSRAFSNARIVSLQLGLDQDALRAASPRRFADEVEIPILLVHGRLDATVQIDHAEAMASALERAGKPHRLVVIDDGTHALWRPTERETLFTTLETFLSTQLGAASAPGNTRTP